MMKPFKIYSPQSFQTLPWRNGLGSTVELLAETPNKNDTNNIHQREIQYTDKCPAGIVDNITKTSTIRLRTS